MSWPSAVPASALTLVAHDLAERAERLLGMRDEEREHGLGRSRDVTTLFPTNDGAPAYAEQFREFDLGKVGSFPSPLREAHSVLATAFYPTNGARSGG